MIQITKELYNNLNIVSPSILSTTELIPKLIDDENFSFMVASGDGTKLFTLDSYHTFLMVYSRVNDGHSRTWMIEDEIEITAIPNFTSKKVVSMATDYTGSKIALTTSNDCELVILTKLDPESLNWKVRVDTVNLSDPGILADDENHVHHVIMNNNGTTVMVHNLNMHVVDIVRFDNDIWSIHHTSSYSDMKFETTHLSGSGNLLIVHDRGTSNIRILGRVGDGTTWVDEPLMLSDAQKKGFRFDISLTISDNEHIFYISDASNESVLGFSRVPSTDTDCRYFWDYREAIDIHSRGEESNYEVRILSDDLIIVGCTDSETYLIYKSEKDEDYGGEVWRYHGKLETSGEVSLIKVITSKHQLLTFDHSSDLFNLVTYQP